MVSHSFWLRTQPSWLWAPQPGSGSCDHPLSTDTAVLIGWELNQWGLELLCVSLPSTGTAILSGWKLGVWRRELLRQCLFLVPFLHPLVPQFSLVPSTESSVLIGWKLNQWELELLSSASDQVSLFSIHWYCSLVEISAYESVRSSASPQFHISDSIHWCAILIGWNSAYESVSSSARPQIKCPYSNNWHSTALLIGWKLNLWERELLSQAPVLLFLTPSTGAPFSLVENSTYESVSSSARPQFLCLSCIHYSHCWKLNLWEREFLSQSPVPVSVLHLVAALYRHLKTGWIPSSFLLKPFLLYSMSKCWYNK